MPKHLNLFEAHSAYTEYSQSVEMQRPSVSYCIDESVVHFDPYYIVMTTAVHGYLSGDALYVLNGYADFLSDLENNKPSNAVSIVDDILVIHLMDTNETQKFSFGNTEGIYAKYVEYTDVSELPSNAREIYVINYQYVVKDSLYRNVAQTIDLSPYLGTYDFVESVREEMFFGQGGGTPPPSTVWTWKAQGGVSSNDYKYYLPTELFDSFMTDMAAYYEIPFAEATAQSTGLQKMNFIIYFPEEEKSYNCWVEGHEADSVSSLTSATDIYITGFSYVDDNGNLITLDISDFVASLPSDSEYLEHLVEMDASIMR